MREVTHVVTRMFNEDEMALASFLHRYSGNTRGKYAIDLKVFFEWCYANGLKPLAAQRVHLEVFKTYLETVRGNKPSTVAGRLSAITSFYALAVADDRIVKNPGAYLKKPKVIWDEARALGLPRQELSQLIYTARSLSPEDDALITLMAVLGLRVSEACGVNVEDFRDVERGHTVLRLTGKGGKPATIPLPPPVLLSLNRCAGDRTSGPLIRRRDGNRLDRGTAYRWVKRIGKRAGLTPKLHPHALRHSAITAALDAGAPLRDAQVFARHSDPRITSRYDRGRQNLDRHASYLVSGFLAGG